MANKPQNMNELVPFFAFRDNDKYKDDIFVGWNGKGYQIQRGKQVMIPRGVYNILIRSMRQDERTAELMASQARQYAEKAGALR